MAQWALIHMFSLRVQTRFISMACSQTAGARIILKHGMHGRRHQPGSAPAGYQMIQLGSSTVYTNTIIVPAGTPVALAYQYGMIREASMADR